MTNLRMLLIEDNDDDVAKLREELALAAGDVFDRVTTLAEGLSALRKKDYDIALVDLGLPDSTGIATLTRLHAHSPSVPIIALTGTDDESLALRAVKQGVQDYLTKGQFGQRRLRRAVLYAVERDRLQKRIEERREELDQQLRRAEDERSRRAYLAIETSEASEAAPDVEQGLLDVVPAYCDFLMACVRAAQTGEPRPAHFARDIQQRLVDLGAGARALIRVHLLALDQVTRTARADRRPTLADAARVALVEVMGMLVEAYRIESRAPRDP